MTSNNSMSVAELIGRIITIPKNRAYYMVYTMESQKTYKVFNPFTGFCPVKEGDSLIQFTVKNKLFEDTQRVTVHRIWYNNYRMHIE